MPWPWIDLLEKLALMVGGGAATRLYDTLARRRRIQKTMRLELVVPPVPKSRKEVMCGTIQSPFFGDVVLGVTNNSSKRVELFWAGIAYKSAPKASGLEVDEGATDLRHVAPNAPIGQIILPGRNLSFAVTSTARLNPNLAWIGVEVVLQEGGDHQTFKVSARQLRKLVKQYARYQRWTLELAEK
jgi:hypothetical protein